MTEDQIETEGDSQVRKPLTGAGVERAIESIKKGQEEGALPVPAAEVDPTVKEYPTPEKRKEKLESIRNQEDTIPPEIKKELTEETEKLIVKTMGTGREETQETVATGEETQEKTEFPKVKPFSPTQTPGTPKARGGAETLTKILKKQEEMEEESAALKKSAPERAKARITQRQVKTPPEVEGYIPPLQVPRVKKPFPRSTAKPAPRETTPALKPKRKSFLSGLRKLLDRT